jgi:hypothetical protein
LRLKLIEDDLISVAQPVARLLCAALFPAKGS